MDFPRSRAAAPHLVVLESTGSTNAEVLARPDAADRTVVVTLDQRTGRGRLGRAWTAAPGTALAVSVLLPGPPDGWVVLGAGVAMARAIEPLVAGVALKWPNDVLIHGRKVCGILAEVAADGRIVLGAGVNLTMREAQLPVPTATSLAIEGADPAAVGARPDELADVLLSRYLTYLFEGSAQDDVRALCSTIGREVRVELSDGRAILGRATGIDAAGRLLVLDDRRVQHAVSAGDVHHLRDAS